jgi:hypothetical protein
VTKTNSKLTRVRLSRPRLSQIITVALIITGQSYLAGCSPGGQGSAEKSRFVVEAGRPSIENSASSQTGQPAQNVNTAATNSSQNSGLAAAEPLPPTSRSSSTELDEVMKQAGSMASEPIGDSMNSGRRYLQMSEEEKYDFVEERSRHVSRMISSGTYEFNRQSIEYIKQYVDAYARRVGNGSKATWGEDLNLVFGRAQRYAPVVIRSFNAHRIPPAIGLYLVVVETEYTNFPGENEAGAAGLFQFIPSTAEAYGVAPSERTNVDKMSAAAAHYVADRIAEFGTDPMSVALCIAGYNRSPDSVRSDLQSVMNSSNKERSFWTLVTNSTKLDKWFQGENIKYVPKYFAAAVVGETPWAFGLKMKQPLTTCVGHSSDKD